MLNQYFIKMRKINVPVIGAGFVFGLVLQLNSSNMVLEANIN